jgi:hypothetical protein
MTWTSDVDPTGPYLYCDGTAVSRTHYSKLFDVIGTTYGVGDGSSTFNLPDLRGEFLRGLDDGSGNDPNGGSRTVGDNQSDATAVNGLTVPSGGGHNHSMYYRTGYSSSGTREANIRGNFGGAQGPANSMASNGSHTHSLNGDLETRPRNVAVKYFIRYDSEAVISADLGNREVAARYTRDSIQSIGASSTVVILFDDVDKDTHNAYNTSTGIYTVPESGWYDINAKITVGLNVVAGNRFSIRVYIDNTITEESIHEFLTTNTAVSHTSETATKLYLEKDQEVDIRAVNNTANSTDLSTAAYYNTFAITKISNPQTILDTATVHFRGTKNSNESVNTVTYLSFNTEEDTHNAWDGDDYIVPVSGVYAIDFRWAASSPTLGTSQAISSSIYVNGVQKTYTPTWGNGNNVTYSAGTSTTVRLEKGDVVDFRATSSVGTTTTANTTQNYVNITKIK